MNTGSALARFTITLSQAVTEPVQVEWFTSDGTAKAGVDYAANKGTVIFAPGETSKTVDILVYGRAVGSEDRSFYVEMLPPTNAILGASIGECIITVDASGSTPVTAIIVPTGPKGDKGDPGEDGVSPDPAEIALEVAPLINVGSTVLVSEGTEALGHPDSTTVKAVSRRVAYAAAAKIATVVLADGDNTVNASDLTGNAVKFESAGFVPRILRSGAFVPVKWQLNRNNSITIFSATAGDVFYAVQYDTIDNQFSETTEKSYYRKRSSFEEGNTEIRSNRDALLWKAAPLGQGPYFVWTGALPKDVPAGSTPASTGGVGVGAWQDVGNASISDYYMQAQANAKNVLGLMQKFTPVAYNAKADGSNDTAAFASCIAAMPSGATMDLQGLTYSVTDIEVTKPMRIINGTVNVLYGSLKGGIYVHDTSDVHVHNINTIVDYANKASYTAANVSGIHFENCTDIEVVNCTAIGSKNDNYLATGSWGCPIHAYQCTRVTFQNNVVKKGDKEGLMTRFCDEVWMNNCRGYECGQSCIGTSGGNKAIINACYSYKAGNTGITMNNQNSSVTNCVVEGNLLFAGIVIGHSHESQAYANNCLISANVIVNSAYNGIMVTYGRNVTITGNSIENAGSVATGNGILVDRSSANNSVFSITGNNIRLATGVGIFFVDEPGKESHVTVTGNNIFSVGQQGIRVDNDGYSKVSGNKLRGIGTTGIQMYLATLDGSRRAKNFYVENNTIEFCGLNGITTAGPEFVKVTDNSVLGFNGNNNANATGYRHLSTLDNVIFYELPSLMEIGNNLFTGTVGTTINCVVSAQPDGLATTGKVLKVENNHFATAGTVVPVGYSSSRQNLFYDGNTRGTDATLVTASIPSSGSVVINNSNITAFSLPNIVARGNSGFYVSAWSLGTITLANTGATSINVTINF